MSSDGISLEAVSFGGISFDDVDSVSDDDENDWGTYGEGKRAGDDAGESDWRL